jgi:hypothetical protein
MDIPKVPKAVLPEKPTRLPYTPRVAPPAKGTYESWSRARPKPTFDDILALVQGVRGRRKLGFKPTLDDLVSLLKKFKK